LIAIPPAAPPHVRDDILVRNIQELQKQLQEAYVRIKELNEQVDKLNDS